MGAVIVVAKDGVGDDDELGGVKGAYNHASKFDRFSWNLGHDSEDCCDDKGRGESGAIC